MIFDYSMNGGYAGKTGNLGTEYDIQWSRFKVKQGAYGVTDFKSSLFMSGVDGDVVLQRIENHIEGDESIGNNKDGDLINWNSYLESQDKKNDILFQSTDKKLFTNVDLNKNYYNIMDERGFTEELGMDWENGKPYDVFEIGTNNINFYDFVFGGLNDGNQANMVFDLSKMNNAKWGLQNYVIREVNTNLWGADSSKSDEAKLANNTLNIIKATMPSWMTEEIEAELSNYTPGTTQYIEKFYSIAIKLMDNEGIYDGPFKYTGPLTLNQEQQPWFVDNQP